MTTPIVITSNVTQLLVDWRNGNNDALNQLMPLVYDELRGLAKRYMRREDASHTLQTNALVNEAYLRLVNQQGVDWQNRAHFFAIAAQVMRHLLVDHARSKQYAKRGGGAVQVTLDEGLAVSDGDTVELLALHQALERLEKNNQLLDQRTPLLEDQLPKLDKHNIIEFDSVFCFLSEKDFSFRYS